MKHILLAGSFGRGNLGEEAILGAMLDGLRRAGPRARFRAIVGDAAGLQRSLGFQYDSPHGPLHGIDAIDWDDWPAVAAAVRRADLVILGGGGILYEDPGYDAGLLMRHPVSDLGRAASLALLAKLYCKPVMLYAVGLGPLLGEASREAVRLVFALADAVTVRDAESKVLAASIGIATDGVEVTVDPALGMRIESEDRARELLCASGCDPGRPVIAVAPKPWPAFFSPADWAPTVAAALRSMMRNDGAQVLCLPFHPSEDDAWIAAFGAYFKPGELHHPPPMTAAEAAAVIGVCDLVVGLRLHAMVFAVRAGAAGLALTCEPKLRNFMEQAGQSAWCVETKNLAQFDAALAAAWSGRRALREEFARAGAALRPAAERSAERAAELLASLPAEPSVSPVLIPALRRLLEARLRVEHAEEEAIEKVLAELASPVVAEVQPDLSPDLSPDRSTDPSSDPLLNLSSGFSSDPSPKPSFALPPAVARLTERIRAVFAQREQEQMLWRAGQQARSEAQMAALEREVEQSQETIGVLREEVAVLRQRLDAQERLAQLERQVMTLQRQLEQQTHDLLNRDLHHRAVETLLSEKNAELARINNSRYWRLLSFYWRGRSVLSGAARRLTSPSVEGGMPKYGAAPAEVFSPPAPPPLLAPPAASAPDPAYEELLARAPDPVLFVFPHPDCKPQSQRLTAQLIRDGMTVIRVETARPGETRSMHLASSSPNLFRLQLPGSATLDLHQLDETAHDLFLGALDQLRRGARLTEAICLIQSPYWATLALKARERYGWKLVYDCPAEDDGAAAARRSERIEHQDQLLGQSDLVISPTRRLHERNRLLAARAIHLPGLPDAQMADAQMAKSQMADPRMAESRIAESEMADPVVVGETGGGLLREGLIDLYGKVSIIVLSYNNPDYLRLCLESIWTKTEYPNYEVIVVDNGSPSEVLDYLRESAATEPRLRVIENGRNLGFARGNNVGIRAAEGWDYLVLLNDDTVVTRGWLSRLTRYLDDPAIGLLGPVSNGIYNEAQVKVDYEHLSGLEDFSWRQALAHEGRGFEIPVLAMYCVGMRRSVFTQIGELDERYEIGMFEDDDYSLRVRQAGYRVVCAEDIFIHHWSGASFRRLDKRDYWRIFEENRRKYEQKWQRPWEQHRMRTGQEPRVALRLWTPAPRLPVQAARATAAVADPVGEMLERARKSRGVILFLPSIGWNIVLFQRPHHLARTFAEIGYLVIYDCSNTTDDVQGCKEVEPNLFLFRGEPQALHQLPDPILWAFPYNYERKDDYAPGARVVYDWIDDLEVFPYDPAFLRRNHAQALKGATIVTTVARRLHDEARQTRPDAIYLPNAADAEHFADTGRLPFDDPQVAELLTRRKPLAGYYGALARWFDYDLLNRVAGLRPDWNFLLIGPEYDQSLREVGREMLRTRNNVFWIGSRPYRMLPPYLNLFDVAMIPFVINDITLATSPLKLYEYFAGGKPVITTPMPECRAYPEVEIVSDADQFAAALDAALARGRDPVYRARARQLGLENSWQARAREVAAKWASGAALSA